MDLSVGNLCCADNLDGTFVGTIALNETAFVASFLAVAESVKAGSLLVTRINFHGTGECGFSANLSSIIFVVNDISISGVLVSVLFSVVDKVLVDVLGSELALELNRLQLLITVNVDSWGSSNLLALGVLANNLSASLESNINVTELDLLILDGLDSSQLLPLNREFLASAAFGVNIGNDPDILNILDDNLLEGLLLNLVRSVPETVVATMAMVVRNVLARLGEVPLPHGAGSVAIIVVVSAISSIVSVSVAVAAIAPVAIAAIVGTIATAVAVVAIAIATVVAIAVSAIVGSKAASVAVAVAAAGSVAALVSSTASMFAMAAVIL